MQYGNFVDNLRLYVRGGSGGMGLPRLGGQGGKGGDVWVVAKNSVTLKKIKDKHPQKRFVGGAGANSRFVQYWTSIKPGSQSLDMDCVIYCCYDVFVSVRALKGEMGKDKEVSAPVGITVTADDGKILGI